VNFLNVGTWELMFILIIAILVVGPERMVEMARSFGRLSRQLRKMSNEFTNTIQAELSATERETRESIGDVVDSITQDKPGAKTE
jgi:sec-independent protein translocase protein TatB